MKALPSLLVCAVLVAGISATLLGMQPAAQAPAPAKSAASTRTSVDTAAAVSPEEQAVRRGAELFAAAFDRGDAKAIAAMWAEDGDYIDEQGQQFQGRKAIEEHYERFFAAHPAAKIRVRVDTVKLVSPETLLEDGRATLEDSDGATSSSRYSAVHVRRDGKWLMASVRDSLSQARSQPAQLHDLNWLVGKWRAEEHGIAIDVKFQWIANKSFLEKTYQIVRPGGDSSSGVEMIGYDPAAGAVRSWIFNPGGGFATGIWTPHAGGWQLQAVGVTADGAPTSAVNLVTRLDDNAMAWQSVRRSIGDMPLPNLEEIVLKRASP